MNYFVVTCLLFLTLACGVTSSTDQLERESHEDKRKEILSSADEEVQRNFVKAIKKSLKRRKEHSKTARNEEKYWVLDPYIRWFLIEREKIKKQQKSARNEEEAGRGEQNSTKRKNNRKLIIRLAPRFPYIAKQ
uniref:Putative neurotoxin LTDF S-19 n=1 Tax=Dolomedes fimbriatus TaxID=1432569 RepID=A0A0K1D8Z3_9ARAC|nr:putative neurotoxin LTDF S-19 [Dolomedes fimbriatus]